MSITSQRDARIVKTLAIYTRWIGETSKDYPSCENERYLYPSCCYAYLFSEAPATKTTTLNELAKARRSMSRRARFRSRARGCFLVPVS